MVYSMSESSNIWIVSESSFMDFFVSQYQASLSFFYVCALRFLFDAEHYV